MSDRARHAGGDSGRGRHAGAGLARRLVIPVRTVRRSRCAVAAVFFINGVILASWVPHVPALKRHLAIGDGTLGVLLLAMAAGAVCALVATGWLVRRFGSRVMTTAAALALCLALPLPVLSPNIALVALSLLLFGAANGTLDVSMNAQAVLIERRYARPIMSSFHALFSLGGLVGAGCAGLVLWAGAAGPQHVIGTAVVALAVVGAALPSLIPDAGVADQPAHGPARATGHLRLLGVLAFAALLSEGAMADWSAVYLRDGTGSSAALAAVGFAACSMMMAVGRFAGDSLVRRFGAAAILRTSALIAAAGLGGALLIGTSAAAIVGFGLVGLGIANAIPILFSRAGNVAGVDPGIGLAAVATTGYLGFLTGPPVIGLLAELTTLRLALGAVVAGCALIAVYAGGATPRTRRAETAVRAATQSRREGTVTG